MVTSPRLISLPYSIHISTKLGENVIACRFGSFCGRFSPLSYCHQKLFGRRFKREHQHGGYIPRGSTEVYGSVIQVVFHGADLTEYAEYCVDAVLMHYTHIICQTANYADYWLIPALFRNKSYFYPRDTSQSFFPQVLQSHPLKRQAPQPQPSRQTPATTSAIGGCRATWQ